MNLKRLNPLFLAFALLLVVGCDNDEMSVADQKKMKDAMAPGKTDFGKMTPDQKAGFEKWKASSGVNVRSAPGAGR